MHIHKIDVSLHISGFMSDKYCISPVVKLFHYCLPQDFLLNPLKHMILVSVRCMFLSYVIIAVIK